MNRRIECAYCSFRRHYEEVGDMCMVTPDSDNTLKSVETEMVECPYASFHQDVSDFVKAMEETLWRWDMDSRRIRRKIKEQLK